MPNNRLVVKEQIAAYTKLLFEAVSNEGGNEAVLETCNQLKSVVKAFRGNAMLDSAIKDPGYTPEQKAQIVKGTFAGVQPALQSVLSLMAERGETGLLGSVAEQFEQLVADKLNLLIVEVSTAVELDDDLRALIKQKVKTELGKEAVLEERVDKSLLGGIIMSTKDERIDASLLTQVERTREVLK